MSAAAVERVPRPATAGDVEQLRGLAVSNGLFGPDELDDFDRMLSGYLDGSLDGHAWIVLDDGEGDGLAAAAYFAPEPFADRLWNLYFLAVASDRHRSGAGGVLVDHVQAELVRKGPEVARVMIVETSSLDGYAQARAFYAKRGFVEEARIRDFYGPGDDKVVFWKALSPAS